MPFVSDDFKSPDQRWGSWRMVAFWRTMAGSRFTGALLDWLTPCIIKHGFLFMSVCSASCTRQALSTTDPQNLTMNLFQEIAFLFQSHYTQQWMVALMPVIECNFQIGTLCSTSVWFTAQTKTPTHVLNKKICFPRVPKMWAWDSAFQQFTVNIHLAFCSNAAVLNSLSNQKPNLAVLFPKEKSRNLLIIWESVPLSNDCWFGFRSLLCRFCLLGYGYRHDCW